MLPAPTSEQNALAGPGYAFHNALPPASGKQQVEKMLDLLFRQKWVVLAGFLVVLALSAVYTMTREPLYEAASFVMVDLGRVTVDIGRKPVTETERLEGGFDLFARNDRSVSGEIRLLEISDQLVQRVMRRMQAAEAAGGGPSAEEGAVFSPLGGRVRFVREQGSDNIIRFTGTSSEAPRAALLANLYAEEYVGLTQEAARSQALALRESLEEKEQELRTDLDILEEQVQRFMQAGAVGLDQEAARLVGQIAALEVRRDEVRVDLQVERAALASLEQQLEEINPQLAQRIASGVERRLEARQEQLAKEEDLRAKILLEQPELRGRETNALREIDGRIRQLRAEIDSLSLQYVDEVAAAGGLSGSTDGLSYVAERRRQIAERRINISRLEAERDVLENRLRSYQAAMTNLPEQSMELAQLERSRLRVEQMYQSVADQLQAARIAEGAEQGYARLIRAAQVPGTAVYPDPQRNLILGAFFGLLLGLALAVVRDKLDNRIYQADQLRKQGLKEIGVIPNMKPLIEEDYKGHSFLEHDGQQLSTSLVSLLNPVSATSEAYRYVRTNIQFSLPEMTVQTLLVASPGISEGKSTTAANLAIVMAQAGRRTLLIDADLRRPQLHQIFGLEKENGLLELLARAPGRNGANGSQIDPDPWRTYVDNLFVITAGSQVMAATMASKAARTLPEQGRGAESPGSFIVNPSELLGSEQMQDFLAAMREVFDIIIIDTPPVLAAADAAVLAARCDATIIVTRAGVTKEDELDITVEALDDVGATVIGILLNGFDLSMAYGHKYRYRHYTRYGRYSKYGYYGLRDET
ncbi:MAG: AAA family ATPase [Rhodothermales bacterium]|nr:AAA family ATPase [Rhodothermales bacterium]